MGGWRQQAIGIVAGIERYDNWPMTKLRRSLEHIIFYLFSFGIMRKEDKEMWIDTNTMALILFLVWFIFGWAYMSECDRLEEMDADDED